MKSEPFVALHTGLPTNTGQCQYAAAASIVIVSAILVECRSVMGRSRGKTWVVPGGGIHDYGFVQPNLNPSFSRPLSCPHCSLVLVK